MRERDRKGDERGKLSTEREEKVKIVMKNRERDGANENEVRKKGEESNDLVRRRKDKARRTRAEDRRER